MKKNIIFRILAFLAVAAAALACVHEILSIEFTNFKAGEEETVIVKTEFRNGTGTNGYLVFAALFPANLKAAENATVTFTTHNFQNHGFDDVTDSRMVPIEDSMAELKSAAPWATAIMTKHGIMNNYGDFEWVVWRSEIPYNLSENSDDSPQFRTQADVKIVFRNEARNVKFHFAAMFASTAHGLEDDRYCPPVVKTYETTGGEGREDYTTPKLVSITPVKYTFNDIMGVSFMSQLLGVNTPLMNETEVYLMGKVVLTDGTELVVDKVSADNLMSRVNEYEYLKYIYPRQYFNVPAKKNIKQMFFWFQNADGSKVENAGDSLYEQYETGTPLK